jgi:hypothetical protein
VENGFGRGGAICVDENARKRGQSSATRLDNLKKLTIKRNSVPFQYLQRQFEGAEKGERISAIMKLNLKGLSVNVDHY